MKNIILLIATLTLTGCHFGGPVVVHKTTPTKTVVVEEVVHTYNPSSPSHSTTTVVEEVVVYEETYYCSQWNAAPFYESPDFCYANGECDWYVGWGCYEVWQWDDWTCEWYYQFDYCI
jgi:hypothetical protein